MPDPTFKQITLIQASLPSIVLFEGIGQRWYASGRIGGKRTAGKTPSGATRITGTIYRPLISHQFQVKVKSAQVAVFDKMLENLQLTNAQTTLKNEFEYFSTVEAGWNNRSIVTDSTITVNGQSVCLISYNVWLSVEDDYLQDLSNDLYLLQFSAEEVI